MAPKNEASSSWSNWVYNHRKILVIASTVTVTSIYLGIRYYMHSKNSIPIVPILLSLKDGKHGVVDVQWKLNDNFQHKCDSKIDNKLKVEWAEKNTNGTWNSKIFDLDKNNDISVNVQNKTAIYTFRVRYFNGTRWSKASNTKSIFMSKWDKWDPNYKSAGIQISGNSVISMDERKNNVFLKLIVNEGISQWKFRIDHVVNSNDWHYFGVLNVKYKVDINQAIYIDSQKGRDYGYFFGDDCHGAYGGGHSSNGQYGIRRDIKDGDIIEMTLDLNALSLSYKINNRNYGTAWTVDHGMENGDYRAFAILCKKNTKFTLLSFESIK